MKHPLRQHIEAVVTLTDAEFDYVLQHFQLRHVKKHQFLVQEGMPVRYDHWVLKGLFKAYSTDENGKEYILQFAMEDWWVSDYQAYLDQSLATLHVDCIEEGEVLMIAFEDKEKLCRELQKMEHFFRIKVYKGYVALQRRLLANMSKSAAQRYALVATQYPELLQRVPKSYIAAYLGVTRETLSRLSRTK